MRIRQVVHVLIGEGVLEPVVLVDDVVVIPVPRATDGADEAPVEAVVGDGVLGLPDGGVLQAVECVEAEANGVFKGLGDDNVVGIREDV